LKKIGDFFGIWHEVWENLQRTFCETVAYHFNRLD
jgi:plasmid maintenance system antidote protein VapI